MVSKQCPKCGQSHAKPGTFCSRTCANSRVFSEESRRKKSDALRGRKLTWLDAMNDLESPIRKKWLVSIRKTWQSKYENTPFEQLSRLMRRRRVFEEQGHACACCGLNEWRGLPITLELDHIDGDHKNNTRDNLTALCPNCHSLTPTWRGRNIKMNRTVSNEQLIAALTTTRDIDSALKSLGLPLFEKHRRVARRLFAILMTETDTQQVAGAVDCESTPPTEIQA